MNIPTVHVISDGLLGTVSGGTASSGIRDLQHGDQVYFYARRTISTNPAPGTVKLGTVLWVENGEYYIGSGGTIFIACVEDLVSVVYKAEL